MIIYNITMVLLQVIDTLFAFEIPMFPDEVFEYVEMFFGYLTAGAGILANYVPLSYLLALLGFVVGVDIVIAVYHAVMWVIRKIPVSID